ncbi:hypothetical protein [Streptomyces sp. NPDC003943]
MWDNGKLQVHSIEQRDDYGGVCVVRCIGGVVRMGQAFLIEHGQHPRSLTLERIERYRQPVEFFDPPHSALIYLSGGPLTGIHEGTVLVGMPETLGTAEPAKAARLGRLIQTGLAVSNDSAPRDIPSVLEALRSVANWEIQPATKVPLSHPKALQEVDHQWQLHAERNGLFRDDGSFLLSISGTGASTLGWAVVKWAPGTELAPRLVQRDEGLDFLAMSLDGKMVCAVTEEEYDYWIVVQHLG